MALGAEQIEHRFGFHRATLEGENATAPRHHELRLRYRAFAEALDVALPDSREKSLVFTALQEASMWSHCAIAAQAPLESE